MGKIDCKHAEVGNGFLWERGYGLCLEWRWSPLLRRKRGHDHLLGMLLTESAWQQEMATCGDGGISPSGSGGEGILPPGKTQAGGVW